MPLSKRSKLSVVFSLFALLAIISGLLITGVVQRSQSAHASGNQFIRQISSAGTTSFTPTAPGKDGYQSPEIDGAVAGFSHTSVRSFNYGVYNRSGSQHLSTLSLSAQGATVITSGPELEKSFDGINHRQQRLANGGNQFSLEPPDQGLCAGNGFIMESVNDALNVYNANGKSLLGVTALNPFYNYPPSINRTIGVFGPVPTDPSCYFDQPTQRWFQIVLTLGQDPKTGAFTGQNQLDLAVSQTSSPLGRLPCITSTPLMTAQVEHRTIIATAVRVLATIPTLALMPTASTSPPMNIPRDAQRDVHLAEVPSQATLTLSPFSSPDQ